MRSLVSPKKMVWPLGIVLVVVIASLPAYYFYNQYQKTQQLLANPTEAALNEVRSLKAKVGKLIQLPEDEEPTVATVSDKDKLKDQPFFTNASNGDKVLIYTQAKKAILYRPSLNKIVDVAPVNLGESTNQSTTSSEMISFRVTILNGTATSGLAGKVESSLKTSFPQMEVVKKANASGSYDKTVVVILEDSTKEVGAEVAANLDASVESLPAGETKPDGTDILIILGKDRL